MLMQKYTEAIAVCSNWASKFSTRFYSAALLSKVPSNPSTLFIQSEHGLSYGPAADLFLNQAVCHVKLQAWDRAEQDCQSALSREPAHVQVKLVHTIVLDLAICPMP